VSCARQIISVEEHYNIEKPFQGIFPGMNSIYGSHLRAFNRGEGDKAEALHLKGITIHNTSDDSRRIIGRGGARSYRDEHDS